MAAPQSTPLPEAPQRGEPESVFIPKSNAFVAALEPFRQDMQAVADYVALVESISTEIETVSGIASDVETVSGISADVTAVAGNAVDVSAVAAIDADVTTVAGISSDVSALAPVAADITAAVPLASDLATTAAISKRQALMARSLALNPPVGPETLRLDYANRAYGVGDAGAGLIDEVLAFETAHTFTRASAGTAFNALGHIVEYGVNEPRYQYDPETGEAQGLLIEEQRTNLLLWSEDFTQATWLNSGSTVDANATSAPNGLATADKLVTTPDYRRHYSRQTVTLSEMGDVCVSVFVKAAGYNYFQILTSGTDSTGNRVVIDLSNGDTLFNGNATGYSVDCGGGWYRLVGFFPNSSATVVEVQFSVQDVFSGSLVEFTGDGTSGIYIWGAQLETASQPSSYIKTEGTQVTRAADNCSRTLGEEFNPNEGTLYAEFTPEQLANFNGIGLFNANSSERILLRLTSANSVAQTVLTSSSTTKSLSSAPISGIVGEKIKMAVSWDSSNFYFAFNGQYVGSDTLPNGVTPQPTRLSIAGSGAGNIGSNTEIRLVDSCRYYSRAKNQAQLEELTAL